MAFDRREKILARLVEVARTLDGIKAVRRNQGEISEVLRPAVIILDSDEDKERDGSRPGRTDSGKLGLFILRPEFYVLLGDQPENIGPSLSGFRIAAIQAVTTDSTLRTLCTGNGAVSYEGCATDLGRGRVMEGAIGLQFEFRYPLLPRELS